VNFEAIRI